MATFLSSWNILRLSRHTPEAGMQGGGSGFEASSTIDIPRDGWILVSATGVQSQGIDVCHLSDDCVSPPDPIVTRPIRLPDRGISRAWPADVDPILQGIHGARLGTPRVDLRAIPPIYSILLPERFTFHEHILACPRPPLAESLRIQPRSSSLIGIISHYIALPLASTSVRKKPQNGCIPYWTSLCTTAFPNPWIYLSTSNQFIYY
ncbi:uncharacterized protein BO96DRAFT_341574 [Aspergillus niger CBS 101883]|uniref:uncharacterized protein n=1 Tax=Aspergillus lacticoffeatus (strain CBS 101883) TaxID=1450533 RepID=UPI000D7F47B4|nr:uncharacterized protein BO96DRAFT_341574 [Aspergillus niger CBS 101883]PYH54927.1 hypothetical protein BO96DRAFT_341574 [Aspergillus niger CBS 101883]